MYRIREYWVQTLIFLPCTQALGRGMEGLDLECLFPNLDTGLVGGTHSLTGTWAKSACKIVLVFTQKILYTGQGWSVRDIFDFCLDLKVILILILIMMYVHPNDLYFTGKRPFRCDVRVVPQMQSKIQGGVWKPSWVSPVLLCLGP